MTPPPPPPSCLRWLPLAFLLAWYAVMGLMGPLIELVAGPREPLLLWGCDITDCCAFLCLMLILAWVFLPFHVLVFSLLAVRRRQARGLNLAVFAALALTLLFLTYLCLR